VKRRKCAVTEPRVVVKYFGGAILQIIDSDLVVGVIGLDGDIELRRDRRIERRRRDVNSSDGDVFDGVLRRLWTENEIEDASGDA